MFPSLLLLLIFSLISKNDGIPNEEVVYCKSFHCPRLWKHKQGAWFLEGNSKLACCTLQSEKIHSYDNGATEENDEKDMTETKKDSGNNMEDINDYFKKHFVEELVILVAFFFLLCFLAFLRCRNRKETKSTAERFQNSKNRIEKGKNRSNPIVSRDVLGKQKKNLSKREQKQPTIPKKSLDSITMISSGDPIGVGESTMPHINQYLNYMGHGSHVIGFDSSGEETEFSDNTVHHNHYHAQGFGLSSGESEIDEEKNEKLFK
eukprot:g5968.t1